MAACGAKRPFIRKQHPGVPISLESGSGRGRSAVHSGKPRHQCFGGVCEHREFVAAAFIPAEKAAVASVTNVT
jgi:hypothetical protein